MRIGCYLIFVLNQENGCMRLTVTENPNISVKNMAEVSGCNMELQYSIGYPSVEMASSRKEVLKKAFSRYKKNFSVDGKLRSQYSSWFYPAVWQHLMIPALELEDAIEELYQFYDGSEWTLEDSLPK